MQMWSAVHPQNETASAKEINGNCPSASACAEHGSNAPECVRARAHLTRPFARARVCVCARARTRVCVRLRGCVRVSASAHCVSVCAGVWVSAHLKSHADGREPNRDLHKPLCTRVPCCNVSTRGCNVRLTALGCVAAYHTVALYCLALQHSLRHSCSQSVANCMPLQLLVALRCVGAVRTAPNLSIFSPNTTRAAAAVSSGLM